MKGVRFEEMAIDVRVFVSCGLQLLWDDILNVLYVSLLIFTRDDEWTTVKLESK